MPEDNGNQQNQGNGGNGGDGGSGTPPDRTVPLARYIEDRNKAQQRIADLEAKLKEAAEKDLSELEKARTQKTELERQLASLQPEINDLRAMAEGQRDEVLKGLPKERRDAASAALDGLPLAKQLAVLRTFAINPDNKSGTPNPPVDRRTPAPPTDPRAPRTYQEWEKLPRDQRDHWRKKIDVDALPLE